MARHIEKLHVRDFRCCKDVEFQLTDLHAFVGPNDSGKSTLLQAIQVASTPISSRIPSGWTLSFAGDLRVFRADGSYTTSRGAKIVQDNPPEFRALGEAPAPIVRLDPDRLRQTAPLIPGPIASAWFADERGWGLPAVYDVLLSQDRAGFDAIERLCRELHPTVAAIINENAGSGKIIGVQLVDGTRVLAPPHERRHAVFPRLRRNAVPPTYTDPTDRGTRDRAPSLAYRRCHASAA